MFRVSPAAEQNDIFNEYHVCYHGTNPSHLSNIIECGRLIKPGADILKLTVLYILVRYWYGGFYKI